MHTNLTVMPQALLTPSATSKGIPLGAWAWGRNGNLYRWCRTKTAIVGEGYGLMEYLALHTDISAPANTVTDSNYFTDNTSFTETAGEMVGANAQIYGGTGAGLYKGVVKTHPAATTTGSRTYTMQDNWGGALHVDSDIALHKPGLVDLAAAAVTTSACGASLCAVTDEYYFWALVVGYGWLQLDAATAPTARNELLTPSHDVAGKFEVHSGTWNIASMVAQARVIAIGAASTLVYAKVNFLSV